MFLDKENCMGFPSSTGKILFAAILYLVSFLNAGAQDLLLYLPPVLNENVNKDTTSSLILTTLDLCRFDPKPEKKPYVNSVQIVDADQSWPPRWYVPTPLYTDSMFSVDTANQQMRYEFVLDAKVAGGYYSFFKIVALAKRGESVVNKASMTGYILLDGKMNSVDTIDSRDTKNGVYWRDFRMNEQNEKILAIKADTFIDFRGITGNPADSSVHSEVDIITIKDKDNKVKFAWNPLEHLNPEVFQFKENLKGRTLASNNDELVRWSHLTSALWDKDGNILYSMRYIGLGKISRKDGHIMWHLDNKDLPVISGKDTLNWSSPHDLNVLKTTDTSAIYSLFSCGDGPGQLARGVVFERNTATGNIRLVKYLYPKKKYQAKGQGNCDYNLADGSFVLDYGNFEDSDADPNDFRGFMEYGKKDSIYGSYLLPKWVNASKTHQLNKVNCPPRPVIEQHGKRLEAKGEMKDWTWFKLEGPDKIAISRVGNGNSIEAVSGDTYCVQGKYGIGYAVSKPFLFQTK